MPFEANSLVASPPNYTNMGCFRTTKLHSERRVRSSHWSPVRVQSAQSVQSVVLVYYLNESLTKCLTSLTSRIPEQWFKPYSLHRRYCQLPFSGRRMQRFLQFRLGCHGLPIATGRLAAKLWLVLAM